MSDKLRMLALLEEAGSRGIHTHDVRKLGVSGNPSERRRELLEDGYGIKVVRENRGKRPGARYILGSGSVTRSPVIDGRPGPSSGRGDQPSPATPKTVICDAREPGLPKWYPAEFGLGA